MFALQSSPHYRVTLHAYQLTYALYSMRIDRDGYCAAGHFMQVIGGAVFDHSIHSIRTILSHTFLTQPIGVDRSRLFPSRDHKSAYQCAGESNKNGQQMSMGDILIVLLCQDISDTAEQKKSMGFVQNAVTI